MIEGFVKSLDSKHASRVGHKKQESTYLTLTDEYVGAYVHKRDTAYRVNNARDKRNIKFILRRDSFRMPHLYTPKTAACIDTGGVHTVRQRRGLWNETEIY